jgi:hypothetical protein
MEGPFLNSAASIQMVGIIIFRKPAPSTRAKTMPKSIWRDPTIPESEK